MTGSYGVTLDKFDRALQINDPVNAANFITTYRADGQPITFAQLNGNTTGIQDGQRLSQGQVGA